MFNKLYAKTKKYYKENRYLIWFFLIATLIFLIPLPYYVVTSNGVDKASTKIKIDNNNEVKGSFNLTYVSETEANVSMWLISLFNKNWDLERQEPKEEKIINNYYGELAIEQATDNATIVAYKYASKEINIIEDNFYIGYISDQAVTDIEIKDRIISINNEMIQSFNQLTNIVNASKIGDKIKIKVINNKKEYARSAVIYYDEEEQRNLIGISLLNDKVLKTNPKLELNIKSNESGPSGGLVFALEIYNQLTSYDYTKGLKIAGTGTIDEDGNVGEVGGIKYKLKGAVKDKCDVFLVPRENYEEASKLKEKNRYSIEIVKVSTFEEAIDYLKNL